MIEGIVLVAVVVVVVEVVVKIARSGVEDGYNEDS
jgi:hypothetical protein